MKCQYLSILFESVCNIEVNHKFNVSTLTLNLSTLLNAICLCEITFPPWEELNPYDYDLTVSYGKLIFSWFFLYILLTSLSTCFHLSINDTTSYAMIWNWVDSPYAISIPVNFCNSNKSQVDIYWFYMKHSFQILPEILSSIDFRL